MWNAILGKIRRRPFPTNLEALRDCRISYGQFGEDLYLTMLLGYEKSDGVFVDVGCFRPIFYSNTYIFYQRGWRGIAIDPNPALKGEWDRFRPGDTFVNCAIAKERGTLRYEISAQHPAKNRVVDASAPGAQTMASCEAAPLSEILDQHLPEPHIDLMNIDCEGHDLDALMTNDFAKYRPTVIAIEDRSVAEDTPAANFLCAQGYDYRAYIGLTKVFRLRE